MRRLSVVLAAIVCVMGDTRTAMPIMFFVPVPDRALETDPDIGGDPVYREKDYFSTDDWGLTVHSYVFDSSSVSLPFLFPGFALSQGEMLFAYLLNSGPAKTVSVDHFAIGNPELITIHTVGWTTDVVPDGYDAAYHQDPYLYMFSGPAEATVYTYFGNFVDPWSTLDPGEYSLVFYVAVSQNYSMVGATAEGAGQSDNQFVPGPACIVEMRHFAKFAQYWLDSGISLAGDLDKDNDVDVADLTQFADLWLYACPEDWPFK